MSILVNLEAGLGDFILHSPALEFLAASNVGRPNSISFKRFLEYGRDAVSLIETGKAGENEPTNQHTHNYLIQSQFNKKNFRAIGLHKDLVHRQSKITSSMPSRSLSPSSPSSF